MTNATIAQKIAKIIAKADSTTNPEEAETFMSKAHDLMIAHGLDLLDLGRLSEDPVGVDKDAAEVSASYPWLRLCAGQLAAYYGCRLVTSKSGGTVRLHVIGRQSARVTFLLMLPYVKREVLNLGRIAYNEGHYKSRMLAATRMGNALALRIAGMLPSVAKHEGKGVNALVPVDVLESAMADAFPKLGGARKRRVTTDSVSSERVKGVNLNRQTEGQRLATKMLGSTL